LNSDDVTGDSYNSKSFEIITISGFFFYFLENRCSGNSRISDYSEIWAVILDDGKIWLSSKVLI
jgi:hypothetical protein